MKQIPSRGEKVVNEYVALFNNHLPGTIEGLYIHGSIALNAYVENSSDIDFITITNRRLTEKDCDALNMIHSAIASKHKTPEMDGVYIVREDLGKLYLNSNDFGTNYAYFNNGQLSFGDYFNFNPITWCLFKTKGIAILGSEPDVFEIDINRNQLISYVLENMNTYWANRIQRLEHSIEDLRNLPTNNLDFEIEWTVLGLLRQFYTLKEYEIISKTDAGEYGLQHLPSEWHNIIKEAIQIRNGVKSNSFLSEQERINTALKFSKYLINLCNQI